MNGATMDNVEAARVRSPADILRLVVAATLLVALLLVEWLFGDALIAFASDLLRGVDAIPNWLLTAIVVGTRVLSIVVLVAGFRDLRLANVFIGADGAVWIIDFGFSEMAASELLLANDVIELVCSSGAYVGAERAVAPALATVDPATLARAVDRLRPWALSGATRAAMKQQPGLLDDIRGRLAS